MIGISVTGIEGKVGEIKARFRKGNVRRISRMSAYQRKTEINSMLKAPKGSYSPAGTAPFTHPRQSKAGRDLPAFPSSIRFKTEGTEQDPRGIVGPIKHSTGRRANWAERIGKTHEFGGTVTVEKRVVYKNGIPTGLVLFKNNKTQEKTFAFNILKKRKHKDKVIFYINYQATYPKRPFAAPALQKTIAAYRQGKFE